MVVVGILFGFMVLLRRTCKGFEFWGKIPKLIVKKFTPYLFSITFELVLMEIVLGITLNVVFYDQAAGVIGSASIAFIAIVCVAILLSFFWKVEDDQGLVHYGLLYNY